MFGEQSNKATVGGDQQFNNQSGDTDSTWAAWVTSSRQMTEVKQR